MNSSTANWIAGASTVVAIGGVFVLGLRAARKRRVKQFGPSLTVRAHNVVGRRDIRYALIRGVPIEDLDDARQLLIYLGDDPYGETMRVWRSTLWIVSALCLVWIAVGLVADVTSLPVVGALALVGSGFLYVRQRQIYRRMMASVEATRRLHGT